MTYAAETFQRFEKKSSLRSSIGRWMARMAVAAAPLVACLSAPTLASAQEAAKPGHRMAVIDIAFIFKNLPSIQEEVGKIEAELKQFDAEFQQKRQDLQQSIAQLKTLKVGTDDYARLEERVASMESQLRLEAGRKQNGLRDSEAKIYFDNYKRIVAAVKTIAAHNGIQLVLRFNSEDMDLEQSESVARGVMKNVVYHDRTIDMTETVMKYLQHQSGKQQIATRGAATSAAQR